MADDGVQSNLGAVGLEHARGPTLPCTVCFFTLHLLVPSMTALHNRIISRHMPSCDGEVVRRLSALMSLRPESLP